VLEDGDRSRKRDRLHAEFAERVRAFRLSVLAYEGAVLARRRREAAETVAAASAGHARRIDQRPLDIRAGISHAPSRPTEDGVHIHKAPLTARQVEIVRLIARGYTNQQIADALVLTPGTVANHVQHILERLDLHSRTQVAVWFAQHPPHSAVNDAARLQFEAWQTARRDELARDAKQQAIVQAVGNQLRERGVRS
jgi:DNA-binding CsgD family transcriptional regulator